MQRGSTASTSPSDAGSEAAGAAGRDAGGGGGVPFADAGDGVFGPANAWWTLFSEEDATAEWGGAPSTSSSVSVVASSPPQMRAGLRFRFLLAPNEKLDLSQYAQLEVSLSNFVEGDTFELFLGDGLESGCSYKFYKKADPEPYKNSLSSAAWCIPSQCGFDLKVTEGLFLADVPNTSRLAATLTDLQFTRGGAAAGSASALGGAIGPGEFCWFLANWRDASVGWKNRAAPNTSYAHVEATATNGAIGGMAFEIPKGFGLEQYGSLVLDATVSALTTGEKTSFMVQAVKDEMGFGWNLEGDGTQRTYVLNFGERGFNFGGGEQLQLSDVERFEIVTPSSGSSSSIDAKVTRVVFERPGNP